ncbi:hypothetical protein HYH02_011236 [Chlamydomonas schloesseri]|uniref:OTU domain-containing protein n=1 Tax=Chlamydomonas schloesseri TaxID=2026947 RepID=A0A835T562_9CHLO|nr:hypothetical protein HYH02_011236 [Chlamydomonas schloesseri]|eukprot:KAG2437596.1 hypothetical protein HYH02_011236 [Chlamydomonas schloesseri]
MRYLDATGFKEGFLDFDRATRGVLDELTGVLEDVAQQGPYAAAPLLLMAVLVEGGLGGTLAALLQGRTLAELAQRGGLFYQFLQLVRAAAQLPDTAQLLARPVRLGSVQASVLGCLTSLAEGPAARLLLDCEHLRSSGGSALLAGSRADEPQLQLQVKMARKVRDTHTMLASAVEAAATRASAAASAALPPPPEAQQLESLIRELQAARVSGRSTGASIDGAWAGDSGRGVGSTYSSSTITATTSSLRYQEYSTSGAPGSVAAAGGQNAYGSRASYEQLPVQPASPEHMYGLTPPLQHIASSRPGSAAVTGSASGRSWNDLEGAGAGTAAAEARTVEEALNALRMQRELQRLRAAQEAAAAARAPGAGGGGTVLGVVGPAFARDAWGHGSQAQLATPPYGGDPLASSIATLTYPWQREYAEMYGGSSTAAASGSSVHNRQQPAQPTLAAPGPPQQAWTATEYRVPPSSYTAACDRAARSAGSGVAEGPHVAAAAAPTSQHLGGYSALAGNGDSYAAARARLVAHSSGGSAANGDGSSYGSLSGSNRAAVAAGAALSEGRPESAVRLRMQEAPRATTAATSLLAGVSGGGADTLHARSRRDTNGLAGDRSSSQSRTHAQPNVYSAMSPQPSLRQDPSGRVSWVELEAGAPELAATETAAAATWPRGAASSSSGIAAARATSTSRVRTVTQQEQEPAPLPSQAYDRSLSRSMAAAPVATTRADEPATARTQTRAAASAAASRGGYVSSAAPDAGRSYSRSRGTSYMGAHSNAAELGAAPAPAALAASPSPSPSPARHRDVNSSRQLVADTERALELYDEAQLQRAIQLSKQEAARAALAAAGVPGMAGGRDRGRDGYTGDRDRARDSPSPSPRGSSSLRSSSPLLDRRPRNGDVSTPRRAAGEQTAAAAATTDRAAAAAEGAWTGRPGGAATPVRRRLGETEAEGTEGPGVAPSPRRLKAQAQPTCQAVTGEEAGAGDSGGMLVSAVMPLNALHQRYADLLPLLCAKLVSLEDDFPTTRRVAGDGNCFYRAALFGLLEHVLAAPDPQLAERLDLVVSRHLAQLDEPQFQQQQQQQPGSSPAAGDARGAGLSPLRSARGDTVGSTPASPSPRRESTAAAQVPPRDDPAAYRGGQRLLRLLRTAWFKCPDAPRPSDVSSLERLLNSAEQSGEVIRFARSLTARELMAAEEFYTPFIPGCGGDYTGLSLRQICERHVLPMGVEVEQLQIIAACTALGVTLAVLDVAGSAVGAIKHGPAAQQHSPPVAWVAHLPGHYDVIYPARPLDVAPGGQLVPAAKKGIVAT